MEYIKINHEELSALRGLPHLQQLLYIIGIKPYIDCRTGIVGVMRGISYQSLAEELYIEPHQGIKSGSPSKDQIRRALKGLEKAGVLRIQSMEWKLVFHCLLVTTDYSHVNKPASKQHDNPARVEPHETPLNHRASDDFQIEPTTTENVQAAIPQSNNNYFVFLYQQFEKFWELYPLKKSKQQTWDRFQALQPTEALITRIHLALEQQVAASKQQNAYGQWVPGWKFPANWLAQHCWEDETNTDTMPETRHAKHQARDTAQRPVDPFWDSCKAGAEVVSDSNIVEISEYRKSPKTH